MINAPNTSSTRPYLVRAIYEWCTDNGLTPYVAVAVDGSVQVPREFVKNNEIVLNVSFDATSALKLGNEFIEFKARFSGTPREIMVPIERVMAIYAKENGQGMSFPVAPAKTSAEDDLAPKDSVSGGAASLLPLSEPKATFLASVKNSELSTDADGSPPEPRPTKTGPNLKRVK
jgi:stringent starvation protein B